MVMIVSVHLSQGINITYYVHKQYSVTRILTECEAPQTEVLRVQCLEKLGVVTLAPSCGFWLPILPDCSAQPVQCSAMLAKVILCLQISVILRNAPAPESRQCTESPLSACEPQPGGGGSLERHEKDVGWGILLSPLCHQARSMQQSPASVYIALLGWLNCWVWKHPAAVREGVFPKCILW